MAELAKWNPGPLECAACGRDLRQVNPTYSIKDETGKLWCSQACRATVTGESITVRNRAPEALAPVAVPEVPAKGKRAVLPAERPKAEASIHNGKKSFAETAKEMKPVTRGSSPLSNNGAKVYRVKSDFTKSGKMFGGQRKIVWDLIKDGMTLGALYKEAAEVGIPDAKSVLSKIIAVGACVDVRVK